MGIFSFKQLTIQGFGLAAAVIIAFFGFLRPAITAIAVNHTLKTVNDKANVSFQIPSPSNSQLLSLEQEPFIQQVFPYYDLFSDISTQKKLRIQNTYIMLIEAARSTDFPFTTVPLQIKTGSETRGNALFIDSAVATQYRITQGDMVTISVGTITLSVPVAAVVYPPLDYLHIQKNQVGFIGLALSETALAEIAAAHNKTIAYSGAYVRISDYAAAKAFFKNYKPLGRMKNRAVFTSEAEYAAYSKDFYETSYEAEIRDFSVLPFKRQNIYRSILSGFAFITFCTVFAAVFLLFSPAAQGKIKNRVRNGQPLNALKTAVTLPLYITAGLCGILLFILEYAAITTQTAFAPLYEYISLFAITIGCYLAVSWGLFRIAAGKIVQKHR